MSSITFDESCLPLLIQTMEGQTTDADIEEMIAWYGEFFARHGGEPYATVVHALPSHGGLNATQRRRVAEWRSSLDERTTGRSLGTAIVLHSAFQRGALTALNWLSPPTTPQRVAADVVEAIDWCVEVLEAAGVPVPGRVRALRERHATASRAR